MHSKELFKFYFFSSLFFFTLKDILLQSKKKSYKECYLPPHRWRERKSCTKLPKLYFVDHPCLCDSSNVFHWFCYLPWRCSYLGDRSCGQCGKWCVIFTNSWCCNDYCYSLCFLFVSFLETFIFETKNVSGFNLYIFFFFHQLKKQIVNQYNLFPNIIDLMVLMQPWFALRTWYI